MREYAGDLVLVTAPSSEAVDRDTEVKLHLRVDPDDTAEDTTLDRLIAGARRQFEQLADKTLFTSTWRLTLDDWPCDDVIRLPRPPLQSVTSVVYTDEDGNATTFASSNYYVVTDAWPGYLALKANASWPSTALRSRAAIAVTFVAGWDDVNDIPDEYKQALMLLIGHWYENREAVLTTGAVPKSLPLAFESILYTSRY